MMDRETRNRIQRATLDARGLLEREYGEQLDGTFDIRRDGTIANAPGSHLDARQRLVRTKLITALEHLAASCGSRHEAATAYVREAAFTTLNRFVALKMLETRGLVQECLFRGQDSSGFKEFAGLAQGLVQLPDHGYRLYIESLFDEVGREVRVLFDRRDLASLLWPQRQALLDLLGVLNANELASAWGQDETIGWVYQYFNSEQERRQMRAQSQAPRNRRELAVRNQFFTPRYVVQFLTDNTLGRTWYEMRQGATRLRDLDYLVKRQTEVFLAEGEDLPPDTEGGHHDSLREVQRQRPIHVPFRTKRDPRDIRVLDPACGSGHFLLYAFDLLVAIYEEAWADDAPAACEATGRSLRDDYPELNALRQAVPALILRHNLHGIDIDARCVQIAALALWIRAQRAYNDLCIPRHARPTIQRTNIVVAEPMPGDPELRREFISTLEPRLGALLELAFDRMELAGEAGSLLRIEDDIRDAIRETYGDYGDLFRSSDEDRWARAQEQFSGALLAYAEGVDNGRAFERRLFAEDSARGLGFIDLSRQRYDVVLMNPPFGLSSPAVTPIVRQQFHDCGNDLGFAFVSRGCSLLQERGRLGAITNRTLVANKSLESWRRRLLLGEECTLASFVDLGFGVMDEALVFAAAYVTSPVPALATEFFRLLAVEDKESALRHAIANNEQKSISFVRSVRSFGEVPENVLAYHLPSPVFGQFKDGATVTGVGGRGAQGLISGDDFRFFRLWWEVPPEDIGAARSWVFHAKGGAYSPYWDALHLVVRWAQDGREIRNLVDATGALRSRPQNVPLYFRTGITWPARTASDYSPRLLPAGCIFGAKGQAIFLRSDEEHATYVAGAYTRPFKMIVQALGAALLRRRPNQSLRQRGRRQLDPSRRGEGAAEGTGGRWYLCRQRRLGVFRWYSRAWWRVSVRINAPAARGGLRTVATAAKCHRAPVDYHPVAGQMPTGAALLRRLLSR